MWFSPGLTDIQESGASPTFNRIDVSLGLGDFEVTSADVVEDVLEGVRATDCGRADPCHGSIASIRDPDMIAHPLDSAGRRPTLMTSTTSGLATWMATRARSDGCTANPLLHHSRDPFIDVEDVHDLFLFFFQSRRSFRRSVTPTRGLPPGQSQVAARGGQATNVTRPPI